MAGHEDVILTKEDKPSNMDQKRADNLDKIRRDHIGYF